jgi:hypothetical protein
MDTTHGLCTVLVEMTLTYCNFEFGSEHNTFDQLVECPGWIRYTMHIVLICTH